MKVGHMKVVTWWGYSVYLRQATTLACKRHVQAMYKLHVQLPAVLMMYIVYMKSECPP